MKHGYTHLIIILDASGSMSSIQDDIKGSFNEFLKKQRGEPGKTVFDLFQFNDEVKRPVNSVDLALFHDNLMARYDCSGCTALNDAVCIAIDTIGHEFAKMPEDERPEHVLCVIITDGMENASREFSSKDVKARIERQKTAYSWQFLFLAANQDAFASGASFGIDHNSCKNFMANFEGVNTICTQMDFFMDDIRKRPKTN